MKWQQISFIVLFSPIIIPITIMVCFILFLCWGLEYAVTGKYNQDNGGW